MNESAQLHPRPASRLVSVPFVLAFLANFLTALCAHTYLHLPGFLQQLGARELLIGIIMGAMAASGILARPIIGVWMDRRGRRTPAIFGAICLLVSCLLYLTVHSIGPWIFVVRIVQGLGIAALFSSLFTIAADIVPPERRASAIALFGISGLIPLSLGGLLGDAILAVGTYQTLFWVTAAAALVCLIAVLPIRDTRPPPSEENRTGFLDAVTAPNLRPIWFIACGFALCVAASFVFLKTYVLSTGVGTVGLYFTAYAVAAVAIRATTFGLLDRLSAKQALIPALAATASGLIVLAFASHAALLVVAGVLCGLGHGYAFPAIAAVVVNRASAANRGAAITIFTALFDVGFIAGGPSFGWLIRATSYRTMYVSAAALLMVMSAVFVRWDRTPARSLRARADGQAT